VTGWAQINGRNSLSWEQKFELDVWYVDHQSLGLDFVILFRTFLKVICRDGISAEGEATNAEFLGAPSGEGGPPPPAPEARSNRDSESDVI
jgi:hypothetical protein